MINKNDDFQDFLKNDDSKVPIDISKKVLLREHKLLRPKLSLVFSKFLTIQAISGFTTLLFCPQFSLTLTDNNEVFHLFHRVFGMYGCMAICGIIFIGSGAIINALLLSKMELTKVHQYNFIAYVSLNIFSMLIFHLFNATVSFDLAIAWSLGAILGGLIIFESSRLIKKVLTEKLFIQRVI